MNSYNTKIMTPKSTKVPRNLRIFLWATRIISNLIVLFIVLFLIGYTVNPQGNPTQNEIILLILFPIGMCVGYLVAWKWPLVGGTISLSCNIIFLILKSGAGMITMVTIFGIPGILFILYEILKKRFSIGPTSK